MPSFSLFTSTHRGGRLQAPREPPEGLLGRRPRVGVEAGGAEPAAGADTTAARQEEPPRPRPGAGDRAQPEGRPFTGRFHPPAGQPGAGGTGGRQEGGSEGAAGTSQRRLLKNNDNNN